MGLRLRFNLILIAIFAVGFATVSVIAHRYLQRQAVEDAIRAANVVLDASAVTAISDRMATALGSRIVEMRVREFAPTDAQGTVEAEALRKMDAQRKTELAETVDSFAGTRKLVVARKIGSADGSPRVRVVTMDYTNVVATAQLALTTLLSSLGTVFFAVFFVLNLMLDRMIVRPVSEMAKQADAVSIGDFSIPEFKARSKDEISLLGTAFNRMRRSTEEAIKLLKS